MSKTLDALRELKIYNTHELLKRFADEGQDVACCFIPGESRACRSRQSYVFSPSHQTDAGASWYDYGRKTFLGHISESLPAAMAWASEKYGVKEWAVCPTDRSARVPAIVRKRALAAIRASALSLPPGGQK